MINNGIYKSPIFYMGNKFDLLPQLLPYFPENVDTFYDLFGGSGCVSGNVTANKIVYNELNINIVRLFELFISYSASEIIDYIYSCITKYDLNTIDKNSSQDKYADNYIKFRDAYNKSDKDYRMLYTLTFYSFCNLMRFNSNEDFNMPYGDRCFHKNYEYQIKAWCNLIKNKNIVVKNSDAFLMLQNTNFNTCDFIYCDVPYLNTMAVYNESRAHGGWSIEDDYKLFAHLERLDKLGIKWGLSNVFKNKGIENTHLIEWCAKNKWNVQHLNFSYSALGKGSADSDEVYICNYKSDADKNTNLEKVSLLDI